MKLKFCRPTHFATIKLLSVLFNLELYKKLYIVILTGTYVLYNTAGMGICDKNIILFNFLNHATLSKSEKKYCVI